MSSPRLRLQPFQMLRKRNRRTGSYRAILCRRPTVVAPVLNEDENRLIIQYSEPRLPLRIREMLILLAVKQMRRARWTRSRPQYVSNRSTKSRGGGLPLV